jgi:Icc-related predicted phosphoesterase
MLQLISDIHLDVRRNPIRIKPSAPVLVVAGDVMSHMDVNYRNYMQILFENHRYGVYVPGNHDVWGTTTHISNALDHMENICSSLGSHVSLLRSGNLGFDVPNTNSRIVGATLWTHIPDELANSALYMLNDFRFIKKDPVNGITARDMNDMHNVDKRWISKSLDDVARCGKNAIVVTHHVPDLALSAFNDSHSKDGLGLFYYCDDMVSILKKPKITAWLYGHCHESRVSYLKGLDYPFVTNALGYPGECTGYADGVNIDIL